MIKRYFSPLFGSILLLICVDGYSQFNSDSDSSNAQIGIFMGGGYDQFRHGSEYDQGGAGGSHYVKDEINFNNSNGRFFNIGVQFKIPFTKHLSLNLEGTEILSIYQFDYKLAEGTFNDGSNVSSQYKTRNAFSKFTSILEKRYGKNWQYYFGLGIYIGEKNNVVSSTKGEKIIHTFDSGTPAAPATIYTDTVIYDGNIHTTFKTERGVTMLTGVIIPSKHKYHFFAEARYSRGFGDFITYPNLGIGHWRLNIGILRELNF